MKATSPSITNTVYMPILLLSGIMLPLTLAPHWLKIAARFNPFSYVVDAARLLFAGTIHDGEVWEAFAIVLVLAFVTAGWAVSKLKKMSA